MAQPRSDPEEVEQPGAETKSAKSEGWLSRTIAGFNLAKVNLERIMATPTPYFMPMPTLVALDEPAKFIRPALNHKRSIRFGFRHVC